MDKKWSYVTDDHRGSCMMMTRHELMFFMDNLNNKPLPVDSEIEVTWVTTVTISKEI